MGASAVVVAPHQQPGQATDRRALLAAAASGVLVGSAIVATRAVVDHVGPASLAFLRYAIASLFLLPAAALAPRTRFAGRDVLPIGLLGIGQFGILIVLLNFGLRSVSSARGALLFATLPLLALLIAAALGEERLSLLKIVSVLLSMLGVGLVLIERSLSGGPLLNDVLSILSILGSAAVGAVCSVLYRPYLRGYPALQVCALAIVFAVVSLATLAAPEGLFGHWPQLDVAGWAAVLFIGANSGIGYFLWLWALGHTTASRVTIFQALSPITASLLGAVLLGETLSVWSGLGVLAIAASLWLVSHTGSGKLGD